MPTITGRTETIIDAPCAAVFGRITDVAGLPMWNAAMTRVCERPDVLEAGTEWVVEFHALGRTWRSRSRCEDIDAAKGRFAYRSGTDDGNPSYADWRWTVTPAGTGSRVEVSWDLHPLTFWRRALLVRIRAQQLAKREVSKSLIELGRIVSGAGSAA